MSTKDPSDSDAQPGEFTRMFQAPPAPKADPPPPVTEQPASHSRPGEFTQMFGAGAAAKPTGPESERLPEPARPPSDATRNLTKVPHPQRPERASTLRAIPAPGEFTRAFNTSAAPKPQPSASQGASQSSEFTQFFKNPLPAGERNPDWEAIDKQPPPPPAQKPRGEFTSLFDTVKAVKPAAPDRPSDLFPPKPVERVFSAPVREVDEFAKVVARPALDGSVPGPAAGASAPALPVGAPAEPAHAVPPKPPSLSVLLLLIAGILLCGILAAYFLVFRT